jgi:hypothetical protein
MGVTARLRHTAGSLVGAEVAQPAWSRVLPVAVLGMVAAGVLVGYRVGLPQQFDVFAPFTVGHYFRTDSVLTAQGIPFRSGPSLHGYDGQWFLAQAYDPLLLTDVASTFDDPRYRAGRMLLPALGWLLAAGQPAVIPHALLAVEVLAVGLGCAACARILAGHGGSRWWGAGFVAVPGVVVGVAFGTAEPLGLALAALGLSLTLDRWYPWAGLAFAGAMLTKETYAPYALIAAVYLAASGYLHRGQWLRPLVWVVGPGAVGLAGWWWYARLVLPPSHGPDPLRVLGIPLRGWADVFGGMVAGDHPADWRGTLVLVGCFGLVVTALVLALRRPLRLLSVTAHAWGWYGLMIAPVLLERGGSAHRALAPSVLAAGMFVIAVAKARVRSAGAEATPGAVAMPARDPE